MDRRYSIGGGGKSSCSNSFDGFSCRDFINFCRTICTKALAFTLAETLIVMGIIGVVAALTLPNLNSSTGDKEKVAKVKKIYSNINDAMGRVIAVYGPYREWGLYDSLFHPGNSKELQRLSDFLKISKSCATSDRTSCVKIDGLKCPWPVFQPQQLVLGEGAILADGTGIWINGTGITIDIDGPNKGSNTYGKDIFLFQISDTGEIYPKGYNDLTDAKIVSNVVQDGTYAAAWIMQYDNADYLKTDSSGKCTNNTSIVLSTTNTTCR
ncbi:type II secretion system protein [bacterium]|nr:type II secretion system protein [bacterium]